MKYDKAVAIIQNLSGNPLQPDGSLFVNSGEDHSHSSNYRVEYNIGSALIRLDGWFYAEELKALAVYMKEGKKFEDV